MRVPGSSRRGMVAAALLVAAVAAAEAPSPRAAAPPGPVSAASAGLPLQATRNVRFETREGTWLSVDLAPNGRDLVFDLLGDLYRLDVAGGRAAPLTRGMAFDSQPAWSPDGRWIAFLSDRSGAENLWLLRADGGEARQLSANDGPNEFVSPEWAADGRSVYVSLYRADRNAIELWQYPFDGGTPRELSSRGVNALGASVSPDGRHLYYAVRSGPVFADDVTLPLWSIERRELASGRTDPVVADIGSAMRPAISPDGATLAYAVRQDGQTGLRLRNLATGADRMLVYPIQHDAQEAVPTRDLLPGYAFAPDGRSIVMTRGGGLVRVPLDGGAVQPIGFEATVDQPLGPLLRQSLRQETGPVRARLLEQPVVSPDGRRVAFSALGRVYLMGLAGGAVPRRLRDDGPPQFHPAWSDDGRSIAYVTWTLAEAGAIWIADVATGGARRLTGEGTGDDGFFYSDPAFVPGARSLLALRSSARQRHETLQEPLWTGRTGGFMRQAELVEIPLDGGAVRVLANGAMNGAPRCTGECDRVYVHGDGGLEAIARDGRSRRTVLAVVGPGYYFSEQPAAASDILISPDGRTALVLHSQQLYLVPVPGVADAPPVDLGLPDARAVRLSSLGADFAGWADGGATVLWALGSTLYRLPVAAIPPQAGAAAVHEAVAAATTTVEARVEVPRDTPTGSWVLRGATLVTLRGDEVLHDADLLVTGDRIAGVGARGTVPLPAGTRVVEAQGRYVVPGLIDAHHHAGGIRRSVLQFDDWGLRATLAYGVTSVLDPSSLSIDMYAYADLIDAGQVVGPRLYTTGVAMFSYNRLRSLDDARRLVRRHVEAYRSPNLKQYRIGSRRERQWIAMAAQEQGAMPTAEGAVDMKLGLTHVLDGYAGNEHAFGVFPLYRDVVELMARAGTGSVLTLMISHGGPPAGHDYAQRGAALTDAGVVKWYPENARERLFARLPWVNPRDYVYAQMAAGAAAIQRAGGVVGLGAHGNYPGIGTHWELQAHVAGGMTPHEALRAATLGSATAIGRDADLGSLEPGKLADFVVLDADPLADIANTLRIRTVVKGGKLMTPEGLRSVE